MSRVFSLAVVWFAFAAPATAQSMTIAQAVDHALQHNLLLLAERSQLTIADAQMVGARLRPNPVVSFSADHLDVLGTGFDDSNNGGPPEIAWRIDVPFERGGKREARVALASIVRSAAEAQFADAVRTLTQDVTLACVDVLAAQATRALAADTLRTYEDLVRVNRAGAIARRPPLAGSDRPRGLCRRRRVPAPAGDRRPLELARVLFQRAAAALESQPGRNRAGRRRARAGGAPDRRAQGADRRRRPRRASRIHDDPRSRCGHRARPAEACRARARRLGVHVQSRRRDAARVSRRAAGVQRDDAELRRRAGEPASRGGEIERRDRDGGGAVNTTDMHARAAVLAATLDAVSCGGPAQTERAPRDTVAASTHRDRASAGASKIR